MGEFPRALVFINGGDQLLLLLHGLAALLLLLCFHYSVGAALVLFGLESADPRGEKPGIQHAQDLVIHSILEVNLILTVVAGTGVWLSFAMAWPDAVRLLVKQFFWILLAMWVISFAGLAFILYYAHFRSSFVRPVRRYLTRVYALAQWVALVFFSGVVSFLLTSKSGGGLEAWWNPTFLPSVFLRTTAALVLACLVVMTLANLPWLGAHSVPGEEKRDLFFALYPFLDIFILLPPAAAWYLLALPVECRLAFVQWGQAWPLMVSLVTSLLVAGALFATKHRKATIGLSTCVLLLSLWVISMVCADLASRGARRPYVIYPRIYANGLAALDVPRLRLAAEKLGTILLAGPAFPFSFPASGSTPDPEAMARSGAWQVAPERKNAASLAGLTPEARGGLIFQSQCTPCHLLPRPFLRPGIERSFQEDRTLARAALRHLDKFQEIMPPFLGTESDADDIIAFLSQRKSPSPVASAPAEVNP